MFYNMFLILIQNTGAALSFLRATFFLSLYRMKTISSKKFFLARTRVRTEANFFSFLFYFFSLNRI